MINIKMFLLIIAMLDKYAFKQKNEKSCNLHFKLFIRYFKKFVNQIILDSNYIVQLLCNCFVRGYQYLAVSFLSCTMPWGYAVS